jgi:glycine dehydrogenase
MNSTPPRDAAVTWPEFAALHPFAPAEQARAIAMLDDLERMLAECTGYDAVSMQPNAGSQGEYAGLLAIALPQAAATGHAMSA